MEDKNVDTTIKELDEGLESLGMLNNSSCHRRTDCLNEMKLRACWRAELSATARLPTKENLDGLEKQLLYSPGGGGHCNKFNRRWCRSRPVPYDTTRRKPLNTLISCRGGCRPNTTITTATCSSQEEVQSDDVFNELRLSIPLGDVKKTDKFPVPLLSRSKSLEDLRDLSPKSKTCTSVGIGIVVTNSRIGIEASLSPRTNTFFYPNALCHHNSKKSSGRDTAEIDSMSMRIEKLDVT